MKRAWLIAVLAAVGLAGQVLAHEFKAGDLTIGHPWSRATPGGAKTGAVYVTFVNDGKGDDKLLKASSPVAAHVSIHTTIQDGSIMKMREMDSVPLPADKITELKPGGMHIMLMGLKQPLKEGDMFPLTLTFAKAGEVHVEVMVGDASE